TALEGAGPVVVEERRGTLHAAVEVVVGVGAGLALLERRVVAAGRTAAHAVDEPREIRAAEQRDHERDDADDADTASDRDATLGAAADAPLADVGALVEGHVTTLVRRRACGEGVSGARDAGCGSRVPAPSWPVARCRRPPAPGPRAVGSRPSRHPSPLDARVPRWRGRSARGRAARRTSP